MLVAWEGPPDKRAGAPTSSKVIQVILTTGNAELRPDQLEKLLHEYGGSDFGHFHL